MPCIDGARKPEHCAEARQPKRRPPKAPWNRHQPRATRRRAHHEARKAVESAAALMRIQILSDLHLEFPGNTIPPLAPDAELVILAGDLAPVVTHRVRDVAARWAGADQILYVPGNHEYYGSEIGLARRELARQCLEHGVTLLDPGGITVDDVRFIGATLWTDFRLEGVAGEAWAHLEVGQGLSDFTGAIRHHGGPNAQFTTRESARRHAEDRTFIEGELEQAERSGLTAVIITHHAPSPRSIRPWFEKSRLNPGFASDLDSMIARYQPACWIHGHMHDRVDERLGRTRVMCNPGGYNQAEGHEFDPAFVVEV